MPADTEKVAVLEAATGIFDYEGKAVRIWWISSLIQIVFMFFLLLAAGVLYAQHRNDCETVAALKEELRTSRRILSAELAKIDDVAGRTNAEVSSLTGFMNGLVVGLISDKKIKLPPTIQK